jgi:DNA-binding MarR family transcriptional regulator
MPDTSIGQAAALDPVSLGCTCFHLRKLTRTVTRLYDQHMEQAGLTTAQFSLLQCVAYEPVPISQLAARMSAERTTITRNLKALVDAGWVALLPGADSRQRIVAITASGRAKAKAARRAWRVAQGEIEQVLGREQVALLHRQLDTALLRLTPLLKEGPHADAE